MGLDVVWEPGSSILTMGAYSCNNWPMSPSGQMILRTLRQQKPDLVFRYPIHQMALFGSRVRGDYFCDSDVDIFVDVDPGIGLRFVALADEIEQLLGLKVDLVSRRATKPNRFKCVRL